MSPLSSWQAKRPEVERVDIIKEKPVDKKDAVEEKTAVKLLKKLNLREVRLFSEKIFVFLHKEITKSTFASSACWELKEVSGLRPPKLTSNGS